MYLCLNMSMQKKETLSFVTKKMPFSRCKSSGKLKSHLRNCFNTYARELNSSSAGSVLVGSPKSIWRNPMPQYLCFGSRKAPNAINSVISYQFRVAFNLNSMILIARPKQQQRMSKMSKHLHNICGDKS